MSTSTTTPATAGSNTPFSASQSLVAFFDGLRATGTNLKSSNAQLARLVQSALQIVDPDDEILAEDAETLDLDLDVIAEALEFAEEQS